MDIALNKIERNAESNRTVGTPLFIQPKLSINTPGDAHEQEADAVADKVMRMKAPSLSSNSTFFKPALTIQRKTHGTDELQDEYLHRKEIPNVQRKCAACEDENRQINRKENSNTSVEAGVDLSTYISSLSSSGQSLSESSRQFFEPRFGQDFSNVKVHTDSVAAKSAQSINALAYTTGNNIVFNQGQYSPNSESGQKLMAHELTHVVQQSENKSIQKVQKVGNTAGCSMVSTVPSPERFHFIVNTDNFISPAEEQRLKDKIATISATIPIDVLGMASADGPEANNETLSCKRAHKVAAIITQLGHIVGVERATGGYPGSIHDANYRAVALNYATPTPAPPPRVCDPHPPVPRRGTVPELRDPHIPSGSLCRGACGSNCPSTCTPLPDVTVCLPDSTGTCHYTYTYRNVISCGSHQGCRDHDDCYDDCAVHGHNSLTDACHRACNDVCTNTFGYINCGEWAIGHGTFDRRIQFSDPPTISAGIPGVCPP